MIVYQHNSKIRNFFYEVLPMTLEILSNINKQNSLLKVILHFLIAFIKNARVMFL